MIDDAALRAFLDFSQEEVMEAIETATYLLYEQQAAMLEIPTDYFILEFV